MTSFVFPRAADLEELPPPRSEFCWWQVEYRDGSGEHHRCESGPVCQIAGLSLCNRHALKMQSGICHVIDRDDGGWFRRMLRKGLAEYDHYRGEDMDDALAAPMAGLSTVVYFAARHHLVKIGYTAHLHKRMRAIEDGSSIIPGMAAGPVELLAVLPGGPAREEALHHRFSHLGAGGEWFLLNDELRGFIKRVKEGQS